MAQPSRFNRFIRGFGEAFGLSKLVSAIVLIVLTSVIVFATFWFFHSAPPNTIVISSGPEGSAFQATAEKYAKILARSHVKLKILPSQGSVENLRRLSDRTQRVDIGFVQGGVTNGIPTDNLVSLGSVAYAPVMIFYRNTTNVTLLSQFSGQFISIGPIGSGTRLLASTLLGFNGIDTNGPTHLLELDAEDAARALLVTNVDAIFLMGDSAAPQTIRKLMRTPDIQLYDFIQADGYVRRVTYLNKLELPQGSIDFGKNLPAHDVSLIGPTVELIAREDLNPALSDLLLEAAREIHGRNSLFQRAGDFPAPVEHEFRISQDATRYYKAGKSFLYRTFPFWFASLLNRILVVFVPMIVVVIPGIRMIPILYRWRIRIRILRWYRALLELEQGLVKDSTPENRKKLLKELDDIEEAVHKLKVPASFADQFYSLRGHITIVRTRLANGTEAR